MRALLATTTPPPSLSFALSCAFSHTRALSFFALVARLRSRAPHSPFCLYQVKLLDTSGGALEYARSFDKQEGRILSVDWDQDGQSLVSGASDATIRVWNATTGKCRLRILVQSERNDPALVWSVKVLPDKSIVSGDSFGKTQIWDGTFPLGSGALIPTIIAPAFWVGSLLPRRPARRMSRAPRVAPRWAIRCLALSI